MPKPTVVDLFAGAGLFGHAFVSQGFRLTQAVERDAIAAQTHKENLGGILHVADIKAVEPTGKCDVLIAGPPCQGFSTLGKRLPDDPRNKLCLEVVRWAEVLHANMVVIENVAPFLDSPAAVELRRRLKRLGYEVEAIVLNALNFGVPQSRRRSFTFASRVGLPTLANETKNQTTVRMAWKGLPTVTTGKNSHYSPTPSPMALQRMKLIPAGGDKRDILRVAPHLAPPSWHRTKAEVTDVWGRLIWDEPSNTLRTCLLNPSKGRYIHPAANRVMSLREAARLQSIPDDWQFIGMPYQVARQIGNSVPPKLGQMIARSIRTLVA
jgi:DNA (cytosine-5)-methyltransferase 1